ncbi:hypothetical protein GCM10022226_67270 [Sphaerisporangium flaviroseum]|uniref:Uncharacterized protein n=2 Tax=Sphaerisporangium flaviroseum TaxID=509199 RepID=A0ABP7J6H6_9ACTN
MRIRPTGEGEMPTSVNCCAIKVWVHAASPSGGALVAQATTRDRTQDSVLLTGQNQRSRRVID